VFFHLMLTTECDLECRYCFGEALEDLDDSTWYRVDSSYLRCRCC
jgi:molybdenum cofactor biosynthesis enzyme MoaA